MNDTTLYELHQQARRLHEAVMCSDYPRERKMHAARATMRRCVRRRDAIRAANDAAFQRRGN